MSAPLDPIDYGIRPEDNRLRHRAAVALAAVFVLMIALPGLLREFSSDAIRGEMARIAHWHDGKVVDRLRAVEKRVDDGAWTKPIRQQVQTVLCKVFREGNRKVLVGRDGWLFHRPGIRALTGRGPVLGPTHSVAKDHTLKSWEGPLPVIHDFAAQLKERGIGLVLVAVPDKATQRHQHLRLFPHFMTIRVEHPDSERLVSALEGDVEVLRIEEALPYLPTDTHWEVAGARVTAQRVRDSLEGDFAKGLTSLRDSKISDLGDLVNSLGVGKSTASTFRRDVQAWVSRAVVSDSTSPIVLLGDSNVNMYDDPSLPFYMPGAGFGSWLSAYLGKPLHIIAINGGGATAVRQQFAALPDDVVRAKKIVIWVIAERDLFMDPAVARENGVEWKRVTFNPNKSQPAETVPGDAIVVDVTLRTKSDLQDLASANYPDAVYVAECTVDKVVTGTYAPSEIAVVFWNFRQRQTQPSAAYAPGRKLRLTLVRWDTKGELTKTNLSDDVQRFDLPLLYAEKAEPR